MTHETDDGDEPLAEDVERGWQEWLQQCASPPPRSAQVRITVDVNLGHPDISTILTVRPPIPLLDVARTLRLLVEAIETGQIDKLQLPRN